MKSTFNDYEYQLDIFVPEEAAPAEGFPVIIVLDGTRYARMMHDTLANQLRNREKTGVEAAIIVGIGHHEKDIPNQRFYDFTAPAENYKFPMRRGKEMQPLPAGGAEKLMQYITGQVLPHMAKQYEVNPENVSLYGHSLGGLFVLWSYLQHPHVFTKFAALSPSIWWNEHELLGILQSTDLQNPAPLYITVGGEEGDMVDDAQKFHEIAHTKGIQSEFYVAEWENHASIIPTTMSRVLRFIKA
ncbi:alpha/beta hydrolase [Solibacillus daqui]|uniref:alpha/beta hydrolase n=1 Tax=Solibacillus daqui TaxID=2912187 RepID=UPI0023652D74|nr:alpha/beta hydrolase-fold protein [Solibacillus daqui]